MVESWANIVAVSKILGHSTLSMTMRYSHPEDSIRQALENLATDHKNKPSEKGLKTSN
jgi:integrase